MSDRRTLTCVQCPRGCRLAVDLNPDGTVASVTGNGCDRGPVWAQQEVEDPVRTLTTSVKVLGGTEELVSVRSAGPIPRRMVARAMEEVKALEVGAPVEPGAVLLDDLGGTGTSLVATRRVAGS